MTHRIDAVFAAAFAACVVCTSGVAASAQTGAGDGQQQAVTGSKNHHATASQRAHKHATVYAFRPYYHAPLPLYVWGAPPLQDPRDAYQGYFANPIDNASYSGSGRATLIFRR